jgi:hypothetical protein
MAVRWPPLAAAAVAVGRRVGVTEDEEGLVRRDRPRPPGTTTIHPKIARQVLRDIRALIRRGVLRVPERDAERWMHCFMERLVDLHRELGHGDHLPRGRDLTLEVFDMFDSEYPHLLDPDVADTAQLRSERAQRQASGRGTAVTHEAMETRAEDDEDD